MHKIIQKNDCLFVCVSCTINFDVTDKSSACISATYIQEQTLRLIYQIFISYSFTNDSTLTYSLVHINEI